MAGAGAATVLVMLVALVLGCGFAVGLLVGRWWALLAALVVGVWVASVTEVEVSHWFLGAVYAGIAGLGIGLGVGLRRRFKPRRTH